MMEYDLLLRALFTSDEILHNTRAGDTPDLLMNNSLNEEICPLWIGSAFSTPHESSVSS
ncbi:hypothetical protein KEM60_03176 [Austwickia sp. TVS 96-490-7B]|nr:hypothetical protein [Austwickia sp. TVS 96-490-7B]